MSFRMLRPAALLAGVFALVTGCGGSSGDDGAAAADGTPTQTQSSARYDWLLSTGEGPVPPGPEFDGQPAEYASAWGAKELCSRIFLADASPQPTIENELRMASALAPGFFIDLADIRVDEARRSVTVDHLGHPARTAVHTSSQGCIILPAFSGRLHFEPTEVQWQGPAADRPWPLGENLVQGESDINRALLDATLAAHMVSPAVTPDDDGGARSVVVLHEGELVGERYADGYGPFTEQRPWSVSKSLTATLVGMMVDRDLLFLDAPVPVAEWQGDDRGRVTLRNLLNMSSGIDQGRFEGTERSLETFTPANDHSFIYFDAYNTLKAAVTAPHNRPRNTAFEYRNGNVLIAAGLAREAAEQAGLDASTLIERLVFEPLGMRSSTMEHDAYGNYIASGQWFTTARDMARLGLLHLNEGMYAGQRLLSEEWVEFVQTPAPTTTEYGGFWWLEPEADCPGMPADAYNAGGAFGQFILVIPSRELVISRLGVNFPEDPAGMCQLATGVIRAIDVGAF